MANYQDVKRRRAELRRIGYCNDCGKYSARTKSHCETCWFAKLAYNHFKTSKYGPQLRDMLAKQNYTCPYSHRPLVIGYNIELAHYTPTSRNGAKNIDNVHFVDALVNRMMTDMTADEFVRMCGIVYANMEEHLDVLQQKNHATPMRVLHRRYKNA